MDVRPSGWAGNASASVKLGQIEFEYPTFKLPALAGMTPYLVAGFVSYVALCAALRFRRVNSTVARLGFKTRESLARMTIAEAQFISKQMMYYEFPIFYDLSLRLALLKECLLTQHELCLRLTLVQTYAVENVAKVLVGVSDLAKTDTAPKRYEDTAILYSCFAQFGPHSDEFLKAVARMNYLHAPYVKSGKILHEDFLYVLYASMADPVRFMGLFEWRSLTDMEHAALGTLWKHIGDLMGIDYKHVLGKDQWTDGIDFMDDVTEWALAFEVEYMKPFPEVRKLGKVLMNMLATSYPSFVRPALHTASSVLVGDRMRHAFGFPEPGLIATHLTYTALFARFIFLRFFSLPRFMSIKNLSETNPKTGRIHHYLYMKEPWYNPKTVWSRWSPAAWVTWLHGGVLPGDGGSAMKPDGFRFEDIGPAPRMGTGSEEINQAHKLGAMRPLDASPFSTPLIKA